MNPNFKNCIIDSSGITHSNRYNDPHYGGFSIIPDLIIDISRTKYSGKFNFAKIYDLIERHVKTFKFNGESIEISKDEFKSGFYMIVLTSMNKSVHSQKVIFNRVSAPK